MYGYIYIITNNINGKKYIGQHKCNKDNLLEDNYMGSGILLSKAEEKYGIQNFSKQIIEECQSKKELNQAEIWWIKAYNACNRDDFYNIAAGGEGGNTLEGKTETEKKEIYKKCHDTWKENWNNRTEKEKQEHSDKLKYAWSLKTEEEMQKHREKVSNSINSKSLEEKENKIQKFKESMKAKPFSDEIVRRQRRKDTWKNKSSEELSYIGHKISQSKIGNIPVAMRDKYTYEIIMEFNNLYDAVSYILCYKKIRRGAITQGIKNVCEASDPFSYKYNINTKEKEIKGYKQAYGYAWSYIK